MSVVEGACGAAAASPGSTGRVRALVRDYPTWIFVAALGLVSAPYITPVWSADDLARRGPYYLEVLLICASAIACFAGRSRVCCPKARRFWDLLGVAFVFWLISWFPHTSGGGLWLDITADFFSLGFFSFALWALMTPPDQPREPVSITGRLRMAAGATVLTGLFVYFTVIPISLDPAEYSSWVPHLAVILLLDLCLIVASARALVRADSPAWAPVYRFLILSWVLWLSTDSLNAAWMAGPWDVGLGTPLDLIWAIPYVPLVLAARLGHYPPVSTAIAERVTASKESTARPVLVYAVSFLLVHVVMSSLGLLSPELEHVRVLTVVFFGTLLCALAVAFERALTKENRVLREARDAAVAETERAQLLTELEATQRLESLGVLAGGIAHDFNNVLQSIMGNADFLRSELEPGSASREHVDGIEQAAERAAELVRGILTYSGRGPTPHAPVDLNAVVAEIQHLVPLPLRAGVDIRVQLDEHPVAVDGDAMQLRQVALNLVINACEAVDDTGVVTISTRREAMHPLPGLRAILEVRDTGVGMDVETRTRIFEPYFTTKSGGRGLGLATTWGIVRGHAGVIDVESQPGNGTRITIAFPHTDQAAIQPSAARIEDAGTATGETVLVVDDEPAVASFVQSALQGWGHSVMIAGDGASGLQILEERADVGLTFLDLTMPGMEAPEMMREMREIRPDLPVIVMTGYDRHTAIPRLRQYQPEAFLYKPFRLADLYSVTERVLNGEGAADPELP